MRAHLIKDGKVVNTILVPDLDFLPNLIDASLGGKIGDEWDGSSFSTPIKMPEYSEYDLALTKYLDSVAQDKKYSDRISCAVRAGYSGPFQAEGIAFATWMDTCNALGYAMLASYQRGEIPQPTIEEMLAAMPEMIWPE